MKRLLFLFFFQINSSFLSAKEVPSPPKNPESKKSECHLNSRAMQASARHSQGAGIGYGRGYTTLEGFFSPRRCYQALIPFIDLRGHLFNDRTYAANAGAGLRYIARSVAWGINGYYDYRKTKRFHYNQISAGLEATGSFWSLHINGYLPVGKKRSPFYDPHFQGTASEPNFAFFQGNQFFITLSGSQELVAKREFAFKGLDITASFRLLKKGFFALDCDIGPYYFHGTDQTFAAGGKGRVTAQLTDYASVSISSTYDNLFHQRTQGEFSIRVPFGPRNFNKTCSRPSPCEVPSFFDFQLARGAVRNEIIVLDKQQKILASATPGGTEVAIDPNTGQPYTIWFVNNLSHSEGTFESPYPTLQQALAVAQAGDLIYVYQGDATAYDTPVVLLDDQKLLSSGVLQTIQTTQGTIVIPAQTEGIPFLENTAGGEIITLGNRNTISGFGLMVLNSGNVVSGSGVEGLSFLNNIYDSTASLTGSNNLFLSDCTGSLLIQNNQFVMDPADLGSFGINLQDSGSAPYSLSIIENTFHNHGAQAIFLSFTGSSSPALAIDNQNVFSPPAGAVGTTAINLSSSAGTTLTGSISNQNVFTGYTGNVINMDWSGSGFHTLAIAGNNISSDPTVTGTTGIFLNNAAPNSSLTISNNQLLNQSSNGISCSANTAANLSLIIDGNTVNAALFSGANGMQINANNTASITGTITNNSSSNHLGADINCFSTDSSSLSLAIMNNILSGPTVMGSFPNGIQINGDLSSAVNLNIKHNQINNHSNTGISLFTSSSSTITATIDNNILIVPDDLSQNTVGIALSGNNSGVSVSTYTVTNNICSGHANANIQSLPNTFSNMQLTITGNTLIGAINPPVGSNRGGIQIGTSNSAMVTATINGKNHLTNHLNTGISIFSSDTSAVTTIIDNNILIAPANGTNTTGINVGSNNSSPTAQIYTITNNICTGHANANIQSFPNGFSQVTYNISNNTLAAVVDGIAGQNSYGIQISPSNNTNVLRATISGNTWTSPSTYQPMTNPGAFLFGISDSVTATNVTISDNIANMTFASYQSISSPTGIQIYGNGNGKITGLTIANNSVSFPLSTFLSDTGPQGIQLGFNNTAALTNATIFHNTIAFASTPLSITNFSSSGISVGCNNGSVLGTAFSPISIQQNTITNVEGNGVVVSNGSSADAYINVLSNTLSLGTVTQSTIGIILIPNGTGKLVSSANTNIIDGNKGAFFGIVALNQSNVCQQLTVQNNTITNVHGNNPAVPIPGAGGGIATIALGTGNLNVHVNNNALSGNTPQGLFAVDAQTLGGSGNLCLILQNNHGIGAQTPNGYTLANLSMSSPTAITYDDAGGNTGTFNFIPAMSSFTAGTCTSCP